MWVVNVVWKRYGALPALSRRRPCHRDRPRNAASNRKLKWTPVQQELVFADTLYCYRNLQAGSIVLITASGADKNDIFVTLERLMGPVRELKLDSAECIVQI